MQDTLYRDIILEHWQHPQNYGVLKNPDIDVEEYNPYCGDKIRLTIKLQPCHSREGRRQHEVHSTPVVNPVGTNSHSLKKSQTACVKDIAFTAEGCAISKASASLFTEEIKSKTIQELKTIKPQFVLDLLGVPLSPTRTKCALLILKVLQKGFRHIL